MSQQEFNILKKQLATSRQEFDTLKEQLARSRQETAAVKREVDSWQNSTILILKQYLIENPSKKCWNNMCFDHEIAFNLHPTGRPIVRICCTVVSRKYAPPFANLVLVQTAGGGLYAGCDTFSRDYAFP